MFLRLFQYSAKRAVGEPGKACCNKAMRLPTYPLAIALDFDSTLGDTNVCMERFSAAGSKFGLDIEAVTKARNEVEASGGSFSPLSWVQDTLSAQQFQQFREHFVQNGPPVLYPDTAPFLTRLKQLKIPSFVVTYGETHWQELKIAASGLELPYFVMDRPEKGAFLAKFQDTAKSFAIPNHATGEPAYYAGSLILIDDKPVAFHELPTNCSGYLMHRKSLRRPQPEVLPRGIRLIHSFDQLIPNIG